MGVVGTAIYRTAARVLSRTVLRSANVRSVIVRRSVAAGEAEFPFSDLDLDLVVERAGAEEMVELARRYRMAKVLFPRLGEGLVVTVEDALEKALMDPYRASQERRNMLVVGCGGEVVSIPRLPITREDAARRLVFWFEYYLARAMRYNQRRNAWKFVLEMRNAWGVMCGEWEEPLQRRSEVNQRMDAGAGDDPFGQCCGFVDKAAELLGVAAPVLRQRVDLPGVTIVPEPRWPVENPPAEGMVVTAVCLQLLLETQSPLLWLKHGERLRELGFREPRREVWVRACRRLLGYERLRGPTFRSERPEAQVSQLQLVERGLSRLDGAAVEFAGPVAVGSAGEYYREHYSGLMEQARRLRKRGESLTGW